MTGGMGSGKSSVCRVLAEHGAYVVEADAVVHRLLTPETDIGRKVLILLGTDVVVGGRFDRTRIAEKVFNNSALLHALELILHPATREDIRAQFQRVEKEQKYLLFVAEVPLLYESGWEGDFDSVVAVVCDEPQCRERVGKDVEYERRMKRQMSPQEKANRADYVIVNNGNRKDLTRAVEQLLPRLQG